MNANFDFIYDNGKNELERSIYLYFECAQAKMLPFNV